RQPERAMTVPFAIHLVPVAGFTGLMGVVALEDLRRLVIPNRLTLALCVLWPFYLVIAPNLDLASAGLAAGCAAAVFGAGALLCAGGLLAGADVRLRALEPLWVGPAATPELLVWTGLLGGLLSLVLLTPLRMVLPGPAGAAHPIAVPYGVAIAAAAIIVT